MYLIFLKYPMKMKYTHIQWKRTTYKSDSIFLTTWRFIFAIATHYIVAIP